jgi:hypothetical protein
MNPGAPCEARDILSKPWLAFLVWWLPIVALIVTAGSEVGAILRTAVWVAALGVMGIGCLINAARCGRVHCYITGPFFLLMALVTLLFGLGILPLGAHGWGSIGLVVLVGGIVLCCLPEMLWGKYRKTTSESQK